MTLTVTDVGRQRRERHPPDDGQRPRCAVAGAPQRVGAVRRTHFQRIYAQRHDGRWHDQHPASRPQPPCRLRLPQRRSPRARCVAWYATASSCATRSTSRSPGRFEVLLSRSIARRLGIGGPPASRPAGRHAPQVVIGKAILVTTKGGRSTRHASSSPRATANRLAKLRSVPLMLRLIVRNAGAHSAGTTTVLSTVTLGRLRPTRSESPCLCACARAWSRNTKYHSAASSSVAEHDRDDRDHRDAGACRRRPIHRRARAAARGSARPSASRTGRRSLTARASGARRSRCCRRAPTCQREA